MKQIFIWACFISLLHAVKSDEEHVRAALLEFMSELSDSNAVADPRWGWNSSSYPCQGKWRGITCDQQSNVQGIALDGLNLSGVFDAAALCNARSLSSSLLVIDVTNNSIHGNNFEDIQNCFQLTELFIGSNRFSGSLPESISNLKNLKILDVSDNQISGSLPLMNGLTVLRAQGNQFSGAIPNLDFSNLSEFNVSYNNLTGSIPNGAGRFNASSFIHNPYLCGPPLPNDCSPSIKLASDTAKGGISNDQLLMYGGYVVVALAILFIILACLFKRRKKKLLEAVDMDNKVADMDNSMMSKPSFPTVELKGSKSKTEYSISTTASAESGLVSSSLVVLTSPDANGLRFDDLLKAPAELLGRGNNGSVYRVACEAQGKILAVKRIKDWTISSTLFRQRMKRLSQVKHPNVMPAIAYYTSKHEKLLVYEYQHNGSLFKLIHTHGDQTKQPLDWSTRLSYASTIAEAIAFMHDELQYDRLPHGNLKSSNILINSNMEPCISEYGVNQVEESQEHQSSILSNTDLEAAQDEYKSIFKTDVHAFGVILLELLTGRSVLIDGLDLTSWVVAVIREEWTVEVFDKKLVGEGVSEERMVNLLRMAIKCVNKSPEGRPTMREVALEIRAIRDDDERSMDVSDLSLSKSFVGL